jgi:hypothetical protein
LPTLLSFPFSDNSKSVSVLITQSFLALFALVTFPFLVATSLYFLPLNNHLQLLLILGIYSTFVRQLGFSNAKVKKKTNAYTHSGRYWNSAVTHAKLGKKKAGIKTGL